MQDYEEDCVSNSSTPAAEVRMLTSINACYYIRIFVLRALILVEERNLPKVKS